MPSLKITVRSMASIQHLRNRIHVPFIYVREGQDIGMEMDSALDVSAKKSMSAYRQLHRDWGMRVMREAEAIKEFAPDFILSNVSYLAIAGARRAGIPNAAMCSLNWGDIFDHYCGALSGAHTITTQIRLAYQGADTFIRPTPSMPMEDIAQQKTVGPIAELGKNRRDEILHTLKLPSKTRLVMVNLGGISSRVPIENWPHIPDVKWLVQADWRVTHPDAIIIESLDMPFFDLLASANALICKPGYGSFAEAACGGIPILYVTRDGWPEESSLLQWFTKNGHCIEINRNQLNKGNIEGPLQQLWMSEPFTPPLATGAQEAAQWLAERLSA